MAIKLYNTLEKKLVDFVPQIANEVSMYVCGVTPYDYPHIGNARAVVAFDIIRRYFEYSGYKVTYIQNFTDIDDKIIARAHEQNIPWHELPERFIKVYFDEMDSLNVKRATKYPLATENISQIIGMVEELIAKNHAYAVGGDVYYDVRSFADYGKLSGRDIDDLKSGARVSVNDDKRSPLDFALWKSAKEGEPSWDSPWGKGRPGWHIECSAMSRDILGNTFDIHCGGQDLIFPHHENEIAQSEGATGCPLAKYWLHNGFVTVNKEKMSKSLKNFFTIKDVLEEYSGAVLRYFLTASHYQSPIDYSDASLNQAKASYERLKNGAELAARILETKTTEPKSENNADELNAAVTRAENDFRTAMDDNFNTPNAISALFSIVSELNRFIAGATAYNSADLAVIKAAREKLLELSAVLGVDLCSQEATSDDLSNELMQILIDLRAQSKKEKNFALADSIRDRLKELDIALEDTKDGTIWKRNA